MTLQARSLDTPDEKRSFEHGEMNLVTIEGATIAGRSSGPAGAGPMTSSPSRARTRARPRTPAT